MNNIRNELNKRCTTTSGSNLNSWNNNQCPALLKSYLNTLTDGTLGYNPNNLAFVQDSINTSFTAFYNTYGTGTAFVNIVSQTCLDPGLSVACNVFLGSVCENPSALGDYENLFCGCYSKEAQNDPCVPTCHAANVIQNANTQTGALNICNPTVCIINDTTIKTYNDKIGNINITNICPSCSVTTPCVCTIQATNISETLSSIGVTNINQYCGTGSICQVLDSDGNPTKTPCESFSGTKTFTFYDYLPNWTIILFLIVVFVVIIIFRLFNSKN